MSIQLNVNPLKTWPSELLMYLDAHTHLWSVRVELKWKSHSDEDVHVAVYILLRSDRGENLAWQI